MIIKDYCHSRTEGTVREITELIRQSFREGELDPLSVSKHLGHGTTLSCLEQVVIPRGYRILSKIPRLPVSIIENLIDVFQKLPAVWKPPGGILIEWRESGKSGPGRSKRASGSIGSRSGWKDSCNREEGRGKKLGIVQRINGMAGEFSKKAD